MKHIKNAKVTAKIQIREGAQIRVLGGGTDDNNKKKLSVIIDEVSGSGVFQV